MKREYQTPIDGAQTLEEWEAQRAEDKERFLMSRSARSFPEKSRIDVISEMTTAEEFATLTDAELQEWLEIYARKINPEPGFAEPADWWVSEMKRRVLLIESEIASRIKEAK